MLQRLNRGLLVLALLGAAPFTPTVYAAEVQLDEVIVKSPKNAAVMPYDDVFVRLKRLRDSKLDRVVLKIVLKPKDESIRLGDVRVAIVNDQVSERIPVGKDGSLELPYREDLYQTNAELRSNQPKGSLGANVSLSVSWSAGMEIPYHEVEETVRQLEVAGKDLLGWLGYLLFFPSMRNLEVPLQYPEPKRQTLRIVKDGIVLETYIADEKGLLKFKLKPAWSQVQPLLVFSEPPPKL